MKFILTSELGRLAKWLRIFGFDSAYFRDDNTGSLIIQALRDSRVVLTRNHRLPKPGGVKIVCVEAEKIKGQIWEVLGKLQIKVDRRHMFTRCIICNEALVGVDKESIRGKVPEYVFKTQDDFITCPRCKRIYWQGTHWGNVAKTLEEITKE